LLLRHFPVISVQSVRYRPVTVLKVINTLTSNVQARVTVTSTYLSLKTVNTSGVTITNNTPVYATYPTLTQLANAVIACGNGWSAQVVGDSTDYGGWPSSDLWVPNGDLYVQSGQGQGAPTATGQNTERKKHTYALAR